MLARGKQTSASVLKKGPEDGEHIVLSRQFPEPEDGLLALALRVIGDHLEGVPFDASGLVDLVDRNVEPDLLILTETRRKPGERDERPQGDVRGLRRQGVKR